MTAMQRRVRTAVTLLVLCGVLVFMAVYGVKAATAPLPGGDSSPPESCSPAEKQVDRFVTRPEVQVSVYNGGTRDGLAGKTLERLEAAGFRPGEAGNAPAGARVRKVQVWTSDKGSSSARLVALAFGPHTLVVVNKEDLGPGVDVVVGNAFRRLDPKAPRKVRLPEPESTCVDVG